MKKIFCHFAAAACLALPIAAKGEEILRLSTTTSTYETGLLDHIFPPFEKKHGIKIHVISAGTGKAIKIAENGDVDVILVHAREAEDKFVADGFGTARKDVMYNDFVILGPKDDPAGISGLKKAVEALEKISSSASLFVSRGDESGTHKMEKKLWNIAKIAPEGKYYIQAGQGMSATLRMADEKNAYVLTDRATFLSQIKNLRLKILVEDDNTLFNQYGIIPVNPEKHRHVKYEMAKALADWLTSPECQKMIAEYKKDGNQLFFPNANTVLLKDKVK